MTSNAGDRIAFVEMLCEGFARAVHASDETTDCFFHMGGYRVRLRFAGTKLQARLTPAFAHLAAASTPNPDLTVCVWDSASTNAELPLLAGSLVQLLRWNWFQLLNGRREIKAYNDARVYAAFHLGPDILSVLDRDTNTGFYWVPDERLVPFYEQSAPLQGLLSTWLSAHGRFYLHAAAVGSAEGGVLIAGKGGSGKSTTTLACVDSDLKIVGDDYCLLSAESPAYVHSLYSIAKLESEGEVQRLPHLAAAVLNPERSTADKALIGLHRYAPDKLLAGFPVRAVLIPRITGLPETRLCPATAAAALKALAPSTLLQLPGSTPAALRAMAQLVKQVPCYTIELGTELEGIPCVIQQLLAGPERGKHAA